jgi:hypothetical protein
MTNTGQKQTFEVEITKELAMSIFYSEDGGSRFSQNIGM